VAAVKPAPLGNWVLNLMVTNYVMKGPWTDKRVRQALNYAVDMQTVLKSLYAGGAKVVGYSLEPEAFGFNPNVKWYPYDPAKAKKLLADAGYPNGFSMTLHVPNHRYPNDVEMAQAVAAYWEKVGVKTEVKVWEQSLYVTKWRVKELEPAFVITWGGAGLLDGDLLTNAYHTDASLSIFSNKDLDDLLNKAAATMDPAKRKELYWKAQELIYDEAPSVQSFQLQVLMGVSQRLDWKPWISYELFFILEDYKAAVK
jgi:peptide/nickel transport system substrate-binding protein